MDDVAKGIGTHSPAPTKIALFRSLFRGREDVYARRFESRRTGRSGYAPACVNEWVRGICEKPRIKCAVCPNRRFLPVTDDVLGWHLQGRDESGQAFVAGVYSLLLDETCFFLAVDFDKAGWQADAVVFLQACRRVGLDAALERSRSGRGGHVWLFFEAAIPASLARRLGSHLLTEAMEARPEVGLAPASRSNGSFRRRNAEAAYSACACHRRRTKRTSRGQRHRHAAGRLGRSPVSRRASSWFWATRSTSPRTVCIPGFGINFYELRRFRIPSSSKRRR
jgi:hypothetical protein